MGNHAFIMLYFLNKHKFLEIPNYLYNLQSWKRLIVFVNLLRPFLLWPLPFFFFFIFLWNVYSQHWFLKKSSILVSYPWSLFFILQKLNLMGRKYVHLLFFLWVTTPECPLSLLIALQLSVPISQKYQVIILHPFLCWNRQTSIIQCYLNWKRILYVKKCCKLFWINEMKDNNVFYSVIILFL